MGGTRKALATREVPMTMAMCQIAFNRDPFSRPIMTPTP
jgi:hypothetical protein